MPSPFHRGRARSLSRTLSRSPSPSRTRAHLRSRSPSRRRSISRSVSRSRYRSRSRKPRSDYSRSHSRSPQRRDRHDGRSLTSKRRGGRRRSPSWERGYENDSRDRSTSPTLLSTKIIVERLTKNINDDHLYEIFGQFGPIVDLDLPISKQGANRGTAYILYKNEEDAEAAISHMHEAQIDGATIHVSIVLPRRKVSPPPPLARQGANINPLNPRPGPSRRERKRRRRGGKNTGGGAGGGGGGGESRSDLYRPGTSSRTPSPKGGGRRRYRSRSRSWSRSRSPSRTRMRSWSRSRSRSASYSSRSRTPPRGDKRRHRSRSGSPIHGRTH